MVRHRILFWSDGQVRRAGPTVRLAWSLRDLDANGDGVVRKQEYDSDALIAAIQ